MLYPKNFDLNRWMLCYYNNNTQTIQLLQVKNVENWYFEKIVFPHEYIMFEAPETAQLEIHYQSPMDRISPDILPCSHIQVKCGLEVEDALSTTDLKVVISMA